MKNLITILFIVFLIGYLFNSNLKEKHLNKASILSANIKDKIYYRINESISTAKFLAFALKNNNYNPDKFYMWTNDIIQEHPLIKNLQFAQDGIVSHVYPKEEHKKALGHDLFRDTRVINGTKFSYNNKKIVLSGPIKLIQNNKYAFIIRNPIFIDETDNFWGFSTVLLYLDDILNDIDKDISSNNFEYKLTTNNIDGSDNQILKISNNFDEARSLKFDFDIENSKITLYLCGNNILLAPISLYFLCFVISIILYLIINNFDKKIKIEQLKFKKLFAEHSAIMLQIESKTGQILDANKSALEFYGYSYDELKALNIKDINVEQKEKVDNLMQNIEEKQLNTFITKHKLGDGTIKIVEVHSNLITFEEKNLLFSIIFDITQKVELEDELIKTTQYLEKLVTERLEELRKKDALLMQQSKLATMGEMIAMISHQWRQPLTTLNTLMAKLKTLKQFDMLSDEKFYDSMHKGENIIKYLSDTIDDFRNFLNKNDRKIENISILNMISKPINLFEMDLKNKNISLEIKINEELKNKEISINSSKMSQVLMNLIKNAFDAIIEKNPPNRFIKIDIFEDEFLNIYIEDSAGGIPLSIIDKIFEPYFSTKSKNGTGLGLYMSKIIIEEHFSGKLSVKNSQNGALFMIKIAK